MSLCIACNDLVVLILAVKVAVCSVDSCVRVLFSIQASAFGSFMSLIRKSSRASGQRIPTNDFPTTRRVVSALL
jgi:hypothetical protein